MNRGSSAIKSSRCRVRLDAVDRRQAQPDDIGDVLQKCLCQQPERRFARQVGAIARGIHSCEHDLDITARDPAFAPVPTTAPIGTERELPRP